MQIRTLQTLSKHLPDTLETPSKYPSDTLLAPARHSANFSLQVFIEVREIMLALGSWVGWCSMYIYSHVAVQLARLQDLKQSLISLNRPSVANMQESLVMSIQVSISSVSSSFNV